MHIITRALLVLCACSMGCRSDRAAERTRLPSHADSTRDSATGPVVSDSPDVASSIDGSAAAAAAVVRDYYVAIDARDYRRAYSAWERAGAASGRSFNAFQRGFDSTAAVSVHLGEPGRIEGAAGSRYIDIPVDITARTTGGGVQRFRGTYTLRRAEVTGATLEQRTWHIYSAHIRSVK